jgi:restriction endonuclease Mrr
MFAIAKWGPLGLLTTILYAFALFVWHARKWEKERLQEQDEWKMRYWENQQVRAAEAGHVSAESAYERNLGRKERWEKETEAKRVRALQISEIDKMSGAEFEKYLVKLLEHKGYQVEHVGRSGDGGVDLAAEKEGQKHSVQAKRQKKPVSRRAVSDAVVGKALHNCVGAMVITNNTFTPGAQELARVNGCILIDRKILAEWILDFQ